MRLITLFFMGLLNMTLSACGQKVTSPGGKAVLFVASTPCTAGTRPVPGIPKEGGCELIKWKLQLLKDTYIVDCDYGMPKQGTRGFIDGGKHLHREGKWIIEKGFATDPSAVIYRLDPDSPATSISFLQLNDNLIHLLDSHRQLMIGTGAWSYTLNKIQP